MSERYAEMLAKLPRSYVEFIDSQDGWEGDLGEELGYVVIWNRKAIGDRWDAYEMALYLSDRWFPFGSNGAGEMLCFDLASGSDTVFWMPYIGMSDKEAMVQPFAFADVSAAIRNAVR